MLKINNTTSKQMLFAMLEEETKNVGDLEVIIDSLPAFMSTPIALTIFSYQVDKYPRNIIWRSTTKEVAEMLEQVGFKVSRKTTIQPTIQTEIIKAESPSQNSETDQTISNVIAKTPEIVVKSANQLVISFNTKAPLAVVHQPQIEEQPIILEKSTQTTVQPDKLETGKISKPETEFNVWQAWFKPRDRITTSNLINEHVYTPSPLLKLSRIKDKVKQEVKTSDQDLDQWLKKVYFTKSAIDSLRLQSDSNNDSISQELIKKKTIKHHKKLTKTFQLITASVLVSCMAVLFLLVFPTTVYTVELNKPLVEDSVDLSFKVSDFQQKSVSLSTKSNLEPTGDKEVETSNATGMAILVNTSGNNLNLTNGGFYLVANGQKYKQEYDPNQPPVITIPARNDLNGPTIEIKIRAVNPGSQPNLPENTRFSVINLREQNVGNALFGLSTTNIQNKEISGDKVITQSDLDLLKTTNEGKIAQDIGKEIASVQSTDIFTNAEWYNKFSEKLLYDGSVGEIKTSVSLSTENILYIYYLPREALAKKLKDENPKIDELVEIIIKKQNGSFQKPENVIDLNIFYSYQEIVKLDKHSLSQTLSQQASFTQAEEKIKEQYPQIKKIEKKDTGINIPMISPKIDINILE